MGRSTFVYVAERVSGSLSIGIARDLEFEAFLQSDIDPPASFLYIEECPGQSGAIDRQVQLEALSDVDLIVLLKERNPSLKNLLVGYCAGSQEPPDDGEGTGDRSPLIPVRPRSGAMAQPIARTDD